MKRRDFLTATAAAGAVAWPARLDALAGALTRAGARDFWDIVRAAYLIPEDRIYLNVATLGPQPRVVVDAVIEHTRRVAMTYPPGVRWDELKERTGAFLNGDPDGFVYPRNTTEAMNFVANGLELGAGDEVITTMHEHIGGLCCWQLIAKRRGVALRQLELPVPATSADELVEVFRRALSPRTRVVSVSHVLFTNGTVMPVAEIAALCRERGIICVVDGAHPPGMMRVDLREIDADFYASSPHKWLCAPQGSGLLYMREEWRTRLWPTIASGDWDNEALGAQRLNHLGSLDESRLAGLDAALRFQQSIGIDRVEQRVRELRHHLIDGLAALPRVRVMSPADDALGAGMVSFRVDGVESLALQSRLAQAANVRTRVISEYGYGWMRLSPHIYNTAAELDRVVELLAAV
ncbi:MAG TPA: aminotransferase class V-fold PLP-dependent enzyme [Longimicrobiales bacterium]|nr:aminotransferase class V-fold PLP-dependent enzyme [Longimicrobiales bacterium]